MAAELTALLSGHAMAAASTPFRYGQCDCTLWVADWVLLITGRDPAGPWRGRYASRLGWLRLARREGGLVAGAERALWSLGWHRIDPAAARLGDVGIVPLRGAEGMAIRGATGWLVKSGDGLYRTPSALVAWGRG